jgi:hypothetical protein
MGYSYIYSRPAACMRSHRNPELSFSAGAVHGVSLENHAFLGLGEWVHQRSQVPDQIFGPCEGARVASLHLLTPISAR